MKGGTVYGVGAVGGEAMKGGGGNALLSLCSESKHSVLETYICCLLFISLNLSPNFETSYLLNGITCLTQMRIANTSISLNL